MGSSGAYGGSGGRAWGKARQQAGDYADAPSDANAEQLLSNIADALDWDSDSPPDAGDGDPNDQFRPAFGPLRIKVTPGSGGGLGGAGGGGGTGGGSAGAGSAGGGGGRSRSRARAATVGGSVAAAGLALRNRDGPALGQWGLSLQELDGLDLHEQAKRILDAVGASVGDLQEDELTQASAAALLALLDDKDATGADAVRVFVVEYVFEVSLTEIGDELRNGTRDGWATVQQEDKLHDLIEARVSQIELSATIGSADIQQAVYTALDDARTFLRAKR